MLATIAVIGILAAIAIPSFFGETRKARAIAEVAPMFNDLRIRMEQYLQEHGMYPDTQGEATLYPAAPDGGLHALLPLPPGSPWKTLNITISGPDQVRCGYTWVTSRTAGAGPNAGNAGSVALATFSFPVPNNDWYYLLAQCRMDPNHTGYSYYLTSSLDSTILKNNEGQ